MQLVVFLSNQLLVYLCTVHDHNVGAAIFKKIFTFAILQVLGAPVRFASDHLSDGGVSHLLEKVVVLISALFVVLYSVDQRKILSPLSRD